MNKDVHTVFACLSDEKLALYTRYWNDITPTDNASRFRRWLFAFCSVHTTWEGNIRGYEAIRDLAWLGEEAELLRRLKASGAGLYNNRTRFITEFTNGYWSNPDWYWCFPGETWTACRDRLAESITGLGLAKTSFALEMISPTEAKLACLDVHMLRLYNRKPEKLNAKIYTRCEKDWVNRSSELGAAPYMARMVWWDEMQGKHDSRYWSKVLE